MPAVSSRGRGRRTISEINMVPFIDVMLVLLIIFMVTAPLITPSQIALPSVGQAARQPDSYVQVIIDKDEQIQVRPGNSSADTPPVPMGQLVARVRQLQTEGTEGGTPVIISADKNVKYDVVMKVMGELQAKGIARVGLAVQAAR